jgi:hypothetical protein
MPSSSNSAGSTSATASEEVLRADYERIQRENPDLPLPDWEALTPEQKESHRKSYDWLRAYMEAIRSAVRRGEPMEAIKKEAIRRLKSPDLP